ncbi:MAG: hypothetical protein GF400_01180 [Candidatus Eisenbacteria bacterium]|nr:hypothetical protein [Candidatus Eisenbacteria bacterium]
MWHTARKAYKHLPVPMQRALVKIYGRLIRAERIRPESRELERFLEESERWEPGRMREYQEERLRAIVRHAYETVPHYRETMDRLGLKPGDIRRIDDLQKLPVLHKRDVRALGKRLRSKAVPRSALWSAATSATSGSPLPVYRDRPVSLMNHACYMRLRRWAGFPFGVPYVTIQGRLIVSDRQKHPPFWRRNPAWNQLLMSTVHLSDENIPLYLREMRDFGARAMEAFPSCAFIIARYLESRDEHFPLEALTTTGEPLLPTERDIIEERFQTRAFDAYSTAERVAFSSECEEHNGHHLYAEFGITEIVDEEGRRQAPGSPGLIVGTSLHNMGAPLLRYACGDVGAMADRSCPCGRTLPMMEGLASRVGDVIVTPDGRMLPPIMVSWSIKAVSNVIQWQLVQRTPDEVRLSLVKDGPLTDKERAGILEYFARRLGADVRVHIEQVDQIPASATGKVRHVVSSVPLVWGSPNRWSGRDEHEGDD